MTYHQRTLARAALLLLLLATAAVSAQSGGDVIQACTAQSLTRGSPCQTFRGSDSNANNGGICELGTVCSLASSNARNGTCANRPVVGDACTASVPCFDPVYNVTCRRGMCVYHNFLVAGDACNANDPSFFNGGCADSLACANGLCGPSGAVGAQCMTGSWSCGAGTFCNPSSAGRRNSGAQLQGVCAAFVATGGACTGNYQCAPGNVCLQQSASSGGRQQRVCTSIADISTPAFIGQQLQLLNSTAALALPSSFLQSCAYSFDCQLGFHCVCNATQNLCVRVNDTAFIQTTLEWLSCIQANGCPDPLRFEPGAKITFGPGSCWETRCCQQTAAYFGVSNPKCPTAAPSTPGTAAL